MTLYRTISSGTLFEDFVQQSQNPLNYATENEQVQITSEGL